MPTPQVQVFDAPRPTRCRRFGSVQRRYQMRTSIDNSRFDGRPILQLDYAPFRSWMARIKMVDEVRRLRHDLYLGIGTCGLTEKERMRPRPFTRTRGICSRN